ncbi:hypothetical protein [Nocardia sp. NRRL S-836]|uniref:hypothetical protein n=1 Tax=Nocardia sp. NRRL S-836 TaxID=1519492 RepID=UPI0006AF203E|nr:hypothetical protein [Nocardia sp. NRRL S-836]KOV87226.1 hypothetical protein ADL03_07765 [Nocardia sp. NRRL S-836]
MHEVLPIGHELGARHDGAGRQTWQVRIGAEVADLDEARFAAWSAAHGVSGDDGVVRPATAESLRQDHGAEVVADLLARRLLAVPHPAEEFASRHRLLPLVLGLGSTAREPWLFSVGLLDQPVVTMTGALYDLWQWAHLSPDLWTACQETARVAAAAGVTEAEETEPERVLAGALGSVAPLLAARTMCFDVRIEGVR